MTCLQILKIITDRQTNRLTDEQGMFKDRFVSKKKYIKIVLKKCGVMGEEKGLDTILDFVPITCF